VSPGCPKRGRFLITREERNDCAIDLSRVACGLVTTSANWCKNAVLDLGNLRGQDFAVREGFEPSVLPDQSLLNVQWKEKCSETELQRAVRREEKRTNQMV
jgi:hypothetical protein